MRTKTDWLATVDVMGWIADGAFWIFREAFDLWDAICFRVRLLRRGPVEIETAIAHIQAAQAALEIAVAPPVGGMVIDDTDYDEVANHELASAVDVLKRLGNYE